MSGNRRFLGLLTISALLHALVLAPRGTSPSPAASAGIEALRVTLLAQVRPAPANRSEARQETAHRKLPTTDPIHPAPVSTVQETGRDQAAVDIRGRQLEAALYTALRPHFYYPPLARQQGWEGEVRLALRVEANGLLTQVHIVRSSGYGILDHAALRSLGRVRHLPEAIALLNGRSHDVILPVQYQLTGVF
jgi:protein TonB